ncbi:MAG: DUF3488 domain-containing transglutaminase family protein [Cardiobacteriaceae bacterium]|nr:DUF3488 domain-containing transglutaminase family protein [Cardiobacteriaceae bacterium]
MALQWISAAEYKERLSPFLWQKVLFSYVVSVIPFIFLLPISFAALLIPSLFIKHYCIKNSHYKTGLFALIIVFVLSIILVAPNVISLGITVSFVGLLLLMSCCKLLESRNLRDTRIIFLTNSTLQLGVLMFSQSFFVFLYTLFAIAVNFNTLSFITRRNFSPERQKISLKNTGKFVFFALPFTILLFFAVPRMNPIWGLQRDLGAGITGLPDEMTMTGLSELVRSDEVAFRVRFDGQIPNAKYLYWRGPVLHNFDGKTWTHRGRREWQAMRERLIVAHNSPEFSYTIIPNKAETPYITALNMPYQNSNRLFLGSAHQLWKPPVVQGEQRYKFTSVGNYYLQASELGREERREALHLPSSDAFRRTRELAFDLYEKGGRNKEGFAREFMNYIRNEDFYYTLEPFEGAENVENFLFTARGGFCQHYANAMAIAARTVGIPSRVILGYLGGSVNAIDGEFRVREENAHAWVELWDEEYGWTMYDPTSAVSPSRVENAGLTQETLSGGVNQRSISSRYAEKYPIVAYLRDFGDAAQAFWQNWVVNLNSERQDAFFGSFQRFGISKKMTQGLLVFLVFLGFILLMLLYHRRRSDEARDLIAIACARFLAKLEKYGIAKERKMNFADFLRLLGGQNIAKNPQDWRQAAEVYENIRYRPDKADIVSAKQYVQMLKKLRINRQNT